jgi:histidine kinase
MNWIRSRLSLRLFSSFLLVILIGMAVLFVTARFATPQAYLHHMQFMDPGGVGMGMMGQGQGPNAGSGMMPGFYREFQASFNEALLLAAAAATAAAVAVSFFLSRGILAPLRAMALASRRISEGRYGERVQVSGEDELAEFGRSFNQMAADLEKVEAMRRRLIGDVAHELRTPLTAITGSMEGLVDGLLPPTAETFEQVHREAVRLNRLVNDLQELSRVESSAVPLDLQPMDLTELVRSDTRSLTRQYEEKGLKVSLEIPDSRVMVRADPQRVDQILTNLLGNAIQYTPQGGTMTISLVARTPWAEVTVQDTGMGILAEHLPHVFDRFYRVDPSRSRAHGGSGIGLTIARHLVEAHGGRIWVESEGEDRGSRFGFTLPLV